MDPGAAGARGTATRYRSRATVIAETPIAPASARAVAHAARVAPVVTTSSTSRIHAPATGRSRAPVAARLETIEPADPEGARDVRGAVLASELELGGRGPSPLEGATMRQSERPGGDLRDERGLVVAAPPFALGMHGDRDHQRRALADPAPAPRHREPERASQPALTPVLEVVERGPDRAGERRAPFELEERGRKVDRHPDGEPPGRSRRASSARAHPAHSGSPSRPHPEHVAGRARSSARDVAALSALPSPRTVRMAG